VRTYRTELIGSRGLELVASDLSFPTSMTFAPNGALYVAEAGLGWGGGPSGGRIWRFEGDGTRRLVADGLRPPVTGIMWHADAIFVSEGGCPGRISAVKPGEAYHTVLDHLPGGGNYHTNMVAFGPDEKLYFSQGAMTNSGIIGLDAYELGWLGRLPHQHDLPGLEVALSGVNIGTSNPLDVDDPQAETGAFVPFGTRTSPGDRISPQLPCTAGVMRCNPNGTRLELVAWGLRNAFGLGFLPDGRLLAIDQGLDDRGSRPVGAAPDLLFHVRPCAWYGWPDFVGGHPITDPRYRPAQGPLPSYLLLNHDELPDPEPALLRFPAHSAPTKFAVVPEAYQAWAGHLCVALFGDERPLTAPEGSKVGRCIVRVDTQSWRLHPLLIDQDRLARPIDVQFHPVDRDLYILDFGQFEMKAPRGLHASAGTGRILRLSERVLLGLIESSVT
jgi:glucose/arabinose dehydrogenase